MKKLLISATAIAFLAGTAYAQDVTTGPIMSGSVEVEIKENRPDNYGATTTINLGLETSGLTYGSLSVESVNGDAFEIDEWQIGTQFKSVGLSFGDQGGLFVESWSDYSSIIDPTMSESLAVTAGDIAFTVGFTDITDDITDISNIQGAYTLGVKAIDITTSADYNFDSEDWALGTRIQGVELAGIDLGTTLSYGSAAEDLAYEVDGTIRGVTAYINGDQDDMLRNVGVGYERAYGSITLGSDVNYDIDAEDLSPSLAVTFRF